VVGEHRVATEHRHQEVDEGDDAEPAERTHQEELVAGAADRPIDLDLPRPTLVRKPDREPQDSAAQPDPFGNQSAHFAAAIVLLLRLSRSVRMRPAWLKRVAALSPSRTLNRNAIGPKLIW